MKTALITGITGQDGSFLAEFLLELLCKGLHKDSYANKFIMQSDLN